MPRNKPSKPDPTATGSMSNSPSPAMEFALRLGGHSDARRVPNAVLGTIVFVAAEVMFFAALISAHTIAKASAMGGIWPPAGQPRLPVERTAINTAALLGSGVLLWLTNRCLVRTPKVARHYLEASIALGLAFVSLQGIEWIRLIREGLTLTSSSHGSFFYLIVGTHALHAIVAIGALIWVYAQLRSQKLRMEVFTATQIFWYFVVALWPIIYLRVYL
jgi:heme/copper-type cytochrome/quinol oxidase subunit 3